MKEFETLREKYEGKKITLEHLGEIEETAFVVTENNTVYLVDCGETDDLWSAYCAGQIKDSFNILGN